MLVSDVTITAKINFELLKLQVGHETLKLIFARMDKTAITRVLIIIDRSRLDPAGNRVNPADDLVSPDMTIHRKLRLPTLKYREVRKTFMT